jgi:2',3'-cyclic-nucleotide 2'-phosphodiesterase (5'-nucleotidase family)
VAVGNHEFDFGVENFARLARSAPFPWISANVVAEATGRPPEWLRTHAVVERGGLRIGIVGLTPPDTAKMVANEGTKGLAFLPEAEAAKAAAASLEGSVDLLLFVTHLGPERDRAVAAAVPRAPLIVGGHSHARLWKPVVVDRAGRPAWIVQAGTGGVLVGRVRLRVHRGTKQAALDEAGLVVLDPARVGSDAATEAFLRERLAAIPVLKALEAPVGRLTADLSRQGDGVSSPAGNLVADAMRAAAGADVAIANRGGIRLSLPRGPVTGRDLFLFFPFENTLVELTLSGAELEAVLATSLHGVTPLEVSGLTARYRVEGKGAKAKATVVSAAVGGAPLDPAKAYRVVTNSFLAGGGDGYAGLRRADARDTGQPVRDAIRAWFAARPETAPDAEPRVRPE